MIFKVTTATELTSPAINNFGITTGLISDQENLVVVWQLRCCSSSDLYNKSAVVFSVSVDTEDYYENDNVANLISLHTPIECCSTDDVHTSAAEPHLPKKYHERLYICRHASLNSNICQRTQHVSYIYVISTYDALNICQIS